MGSEPAEGLASLLWSLVLSSSLLMLLRLSSWFSAGEGDSFGGEGDSFGLMRVSATILCFPWLGAAALVFVVVAMVGPKTRLGLASLVVAVLVSQVLNLFREFFD